MEFACVRYSNLWVFIEIFTASLNEPAKTLRLHSVALYEHFYRGQCVLDSLSHDLSIQEQFVQRFTRDLVANLAFNFVAQKLPKPIRLFGHFLWVSVCQL